MKKNITAVADARRLTHLTTLFIILFIFGICFSILTIPVSLDISIAGFAVNAVGTFLLWLCMNGAEKAKNDVKSLSQAKLVAGTKFLEYMPFIFLIGFILSRSGATDVTFALDVLTVMVWCAVLVISIICVRMIAEKRISKIFVIQTEGEPHKKRFFVTILEWIDALFWAVFYVFLFNIFIFQLYEIPSESMVPSFMVQDRVFVFKTSSGPQFPLSKVRLPILTKYQKGDIVVLRNPRYERTNRSECRSMFSQFVYMITATKVNLMRTDDTGRIIADPLVKRIVGVPGEQLVMVDGVLYSRTSADNEFNVSSVDADYAHWNLNTLPDEEKSFVRRIPLTAEQFSVMEDVERERRDFDMVHAAAECRRIADLFALCVKQAGYTDSEDMFVPRTMEYTYLYQQFDNIAHKLIVSHKGADWFSAFMTDWTQTYTGTFDDPYSEMTAKLNVMLKLNYGKMLLATIQNIAGGFSVSKKAEYESFVWSLFEQAQRYVLCLDIMDQRNMPVFPPNGGLEPGRYFMMGDNRFNSLDLRHSYTFYDRPLNESDPYSMVYKSNMDPTSLPQTDILGVTLFRFWPVSRIGLLKRK